MKKDRLAPYILVSFLLHAGVFIGVHHFLKLPAEELETAELIAVEMMVVREESPASQPEFVPGDRIWPNKTLQTKSQIMTETAPDRLVDDITTPMPKAGGLEPKVTMAGMATPGYIAEALSGESADSKSIVPPLPVLPLQISSVTPAAPIDTTLLEVKIPAIPVETNAALTAADSQTPQKVATPLPASRPTAAPGIESPSLAATGKDEPQMNIAMVPALSFIPVARKSESVTGKPMILASQMSPRQFSPADPSAPTTSVPLDVKLPVVPIEAKAATISADFQTPLKAALPLPASRPTAASFLEPPKITATSKDEPRLIVAMVPTRGFTPVARSGEAVAGNPMISASPISPWQFSPADPSAPTTSVPLDVSLPVVAIEAKAATNPADFQTPQKMETPLASRRRPEVLTVEHQPIPRASTYEPTLMVSTLQLSSHPSGAQIYVDGMLNGKTPLDLELTLGKHEVRLALPDFYDWAAQFELTEKNKTHPIFFRLLPVE